MENSSREGERDQPTPQTCFVAFSEIYVPDDGVANLEGAFADRLGAVDHWPGFIRLEVWADVSDPTSFAMVSWWNSPESFKTYMQSSDHRRSHERIPKGEHRPRPRRFSKFRVVAR